MTGLIESAKLRLSYSDTEWRVRPWTILVHIYLLSKRTAPFKERANLTMLSILKLGNSPNSYFTWGLVSSAFVIEDFQEKLPHFKNWSRASTWKPSEQHSWYSFLASQGGLCGLRLACRKSGFINCFPFLAVPAVSFSECPTFAFVTLRRTLFKGLPLDWFRLFVNFSFIF